MTTPRGCITAPLMSFSVPLGRFVSLRLLSAGTAKQVVHLISDDECRHCRRPDASVTGQAQQIGASGRIAIDFPQANLQLRMLRGESAGWALAALQCGQPSHTNISSTVALANA